VSTQVGQIIANARLERLLGRGFLGESYLARLTANGRQVVVKVLHDHFTGGAAFRDRFNASVRVAAQVRDPQIVPVEDFGESGGRFYLVVPFYPDGSFRGLLQRYQTDLPVPRAVAIAKQVAGALAVAHASGLLHRDLKPENVLLTKREGTAGFAGAKAQVADFGLTQLAEVGVTIGGNVAFGSYPYLSPEHCKGTELTAASDIYSLGIILYEAITGGPPFQVKTLGDALNKHLSAEVPKPRSVVPTLPAGLEAVVLRCLAKDPAARFQSAYDLATALGALGLPGEIEINVDRPQVAAPGPAPSSGIVVKMKLPGQPASEPPRSAAPPPPAGQPNKWVIKLGDQPSVERVAAPPPAAPPPSVPPPAVVFQAPPPASPPPRPPSPPPIRMPDPAAETMLGPPPSQPPNVPLGGQRWQVNLDAPGAGPGSGAGLSPLEMTGPLPRPGSDSPGGLGDSFVSPSPRPQAPPPPKRKPRPGKSSRAVTIVTDPPALTLTPGQPAVVRITIANTSRRVEHYSIAVDVVQGPGGSPARWVELPRERVQLIPEGRTTVPLKILVPRTPESAAGDYEIELSVIGNVSQEVGTAVLTWTVLPYFDTTLTVNPARAWAWRKASYTVGLANHGNAMVRCGLTATDEDHALRYHFSQPEVTLDHGVHAAIDLKVRGRLRPLGSTENRTCTIRVDRLDSVLGLGAESTSTRAQFAHRAVVPTWLLPVVLALGLAIYGLWPRTNLAIEVTPPNLSATVAFRTRVIAVVKNQKGDPVPDKVIKWAVQDSNIVQVAGVVGDTVTLLARKVGNTTLTATTARAPAVSVQITVAIAAVESITLAPNTLSLAIGETRRLASAIIDAAGKPVSRNPAWSSSDPSVATVGNGEVTAKAPGRAVITAQVEDKSAIANILVRSDSAGIVVATAGEDCLGYEPSLLALKKENPAGWVVSQQGRALLRLDQKGDGEKALAVARRYKQHCYIGRRNGRPDSTNYYIEYWKGRTDVRTEVKKEECRPYNPSDLRVIEVGADWELRSGGIAIVRAASKLDADKAREVAAQHVAFCQIGTKNRRPNHRLYVVQYWK